MNYFELVKEVEIIFNRLSDVFGEDKVFSSITDIPRRRAQEKTFDFELYPTRIRDYSLQGLRFKLVTITDKESILNSEVVTEVELCLFLNDSEEDSWNYECSEGCRKGRTPISPVDEITEELETFYEHFREGAESRIWAAKEIDFEYKVQPVLDFAEGVDHYSEGGM